MSIIYDKEKKKELELKRDALALKPLLWNLRTEEKGVYNKVKSNINNLNINFKNSFIIFSKNQIYKSYSIAGLMKSFSRNTRYYVLDLSILLDVWYNNNALINKSKLLNCDILILHGTGASWQAENKKDALLELVSIRRTMGKLTWLYIEQTNPQEFDVLYPGVSASFGKTHRSEY